MRNRLSLLSTRYLPFLVVAAIMALLVVLAPSKEPGSGTLSAGDEFSGADFAAGEADDPSGGFGGSADFGAGSGSGGSGTVRSGSATRGGDGTGDSGGSGGSIGGGGGGGDLSNCDANGMQKAPVYPIYVSCRPVFTGDNGGATMQGVTATEFRYTWWNPPSNAVVDGLLAASGFAREPVPFCQTMRAYENSMQKYFEMSGRKLVALDGPGNNSGSDDCDGIYNYFQSTCPSDQVDAACLRAEAQTIAEQMKPAVVISPRSLAVFEEELARRGTTLIGYDGARERFQQFAPYLWGSTGSLPIEKILGLNAEYYCKRLVGQEPVYGGQDVQAFPGTRHIGLVYPDNGDGALQPAIDLWVDMIHGCGDADAKTYTYQSDPARAAQQAANIVAQLRADGVTTLSFCCDPVSYYFVLQEIDRNRYYPEHFIVPSSSIASDAVGNIAEDLGFGEQWKHAFGVSNYAINQDDANLPYRRAYADGGGPGGKAGAAPIEVESYGVFLPMMQMIHNGAAAMGNKPAGVITPVSIFRGMQDMPPVHWTKRTPTLDYAPPDPFKDQRDVAEIWWNPDLYSYYDDTNGAMCYMNGAQRYDTGQIPTGRPNLFGGSEQCARLD